MPNYLFIKENAQPEDRLLFIATMKMKKKLEILKSLFVQNEFEVIEFYFDKYGDEDSYIEMNSQLEYKLPAYIDADSDVIVNLTGGTKLMCISVKDIIQELNASARFYYIPLGVNKIIPLNDGEDIKPIMHRVSVDEYFRLSGINKYENLQLVKSPEYSKVMFDKFINLKGSYYRVLEFLRNNSNRDPKRKKSYDITELERGISDFAPMGQLRNFLRDLDFPLDDENYLTVEEVNYIIGGWFEDYVYNMIEETIKPNDILLNVTIMPDNAAKKNRNELDVVFTHGNKLFIIECKSGLLPGTDFFRKIVYKASALKDSVVSQLSAYSYIFSLKKEDLELSKIADNMKIKYCSREYFTEKSKMKQLISEINGKARN